MVMSLSFTGIRFIVTLPNGLRGNQQVPARLPSGSQKGPAKCSVAIVNIGVHHAIKSDLEGPRARLLCTPRSKALGAWHTRVVDACISARRITPPQLRVLPCQPRSAVRTDTHSRHLTLTQATHSHHLPCHSQPLPRGARTQRLQRSSTRSTRRGQGQGKASHDPEFNNEYGARGPARSRRNSIAASPLAAPVPRRRRPARAARGRRPGRDARVRDARGHCGAPPARLARHCRRRALLLAGRPRHRRHRHDARRASRLPGRGRRRRRGRQRG